MYTIGFKFLKNDDEMLQKTKESFENAATVNSSPLDGIDTVLLIIQIAEFSIVFAEFVIEYIVKPIIKSKKQKQPPKETDSSKDVLSISRCIVYNGKTITPSLILAKLEGKDCTPQNVLEVLCEEFEEK